MCVSCGCTAPNDKAGDPRNITLDDLKAAASAAKIPLKQVGENIARATGALPEVSKR
jgi:hypothetical protein